MYEGRETTNREGVEGEGIEGSAGRTEGGKGVIKREGDDHHQEKYTIITETLSRVPSWSALSTSCLAASSGGIPEA